MPIKSLSLRPKREEAKPCVTCYIIKGAPFLNNCVAILRKLMKTPSLKRTNNVTNSVTNSFRIQRSPITLNVFSQPL